ncbi:MAG: cation-transporting P-type ATPase [Methylocapsa sp.]|nr:cation-transporting P-type ATPase [Methylocapsa sp.]
MIAGSQTGQAVEIIHSAVPGRARVHIPGLRRSRWLKRCLESTLGESEGISHASASTATGNLLLLYDRRMDLQGLIQNIEQLLRTDRARLEKHIARRPASWHLMQATKVLRRLRSSLGGLSPEVIEHRIKLRGPNTLPAIPGRSRWEILAEQFQSMPVALLICAAALSALTGAPIDAVVVLCVVVLNAGIGYATENYAERTISSLTKSARNPVPAVRDGRQDLVPVEAIVPGDLLDLRPGVVIAADARVVEANGLTINESMLTGESTPVPKSPECLGPSVPLAERSNLVYRGTIVTGGNGLAVVVATGADTEIGRVQALIGTANAPATPMQRQLKRLGRQLVGIAGGACGLVFLVGFLRGFGILQTLKSAVVLAVAAVPEGLPTLATTTLALGIERMRRHKVLVRRLGAIETLAAVRVICLDKTGTLTLNRMTVSEIDCSGQNFRASDGGILARDGQTVRASAIPELELLAEIVALCNETVLAGNGREAGLNGSPTESALIEFALNLGLDVLELRRQYPLADVIYRSERRLFMMTIHEAGRDGRLAAVKGSPEEVLALCQRVQLGNEQIPLSESKRQLIKQANRRMANDGQRVLGAAYAWLPGGGIQGSTVPSDLTWAGLIGMADPLRDGIGELLGVLRRAGISPVILTGDQKGTAAAIARRLDLSDGDQLRIADAAQLERLGSLPQLSQVPHVFARVSPAQKLKIVRALQQAGHVVAMTGDGINDSPALKAADIGIAMGHSGSEAAREVAHIVLEDDNLMSLAPAIEQGRTIFSNIQKAIRFLLATNLSEILVMLAAPAAGLGQPLTPAQLLWINLISDVFPALALGVEPPGPNAMGEPRSSPQAEIISPRDFRLLGGQAALMSAGALGAYAYGLRKYGQGNKARTICFASLITSQLLHSLSCRSREHGGFSPALPPNPILSAVLGLSFAFQSAALFFRPIQRILGVAPIGVSDALVSLAAGTIPFVVTEAAKRSDEEPQMDG